MFEYFVYILTNKWNTTLYIGFTNDIIRRIHEHRSKKFMGFTKKYNIQKLVYFEKALTAEEAKIREQQLKKWNRQWKINLIEKMNPDWEDLSLRFDEYMTHDEILKLLFGNKNSI